MSIIKPEVLAPVGGLEQLLAAVRCGADAVYLGAKGFNARRNAENFDQNSLADAVAYCHARGVKAYVTVNTLVTDDEREQLEDTAMEIAQSGADAVIIQDMSVLKLFRDRCPSIALHASTQTVVHNASGAKFLQDVGYDRFVLARELSLKEIETIIRSVDIEAESFVHGALCMSISGGCYLSSMIGGRSGNRGLCAQPCRLDFRLNGRDHALSLKDMSFIDHIQDLANAGVASFKIEGRMKRPEYVAAAVTACKNALAGQPYDKKGLQAVFSRSGFTDGYLTGKRDATMFGYRTKEDVVAADDVLKTYAASYRKETPCVPLEATFTMDENESILQLSAAGKTVCIAGEAPQKALKRPTEEESVRRSLEKLGDTPFYLASLDTKIGDGLMLPASVLNAMRRDGASKLLEELSCTPAHELQVEQVEKITPYAPKVHAYWARFSSVKQMGEKDAFEYIILPMEEILKAESVAEELGDKLICELPSLCFPEMEEKLQRDLQRIKDLGISHIWANNIYAIELGRQYDMQIHGGWGLNIANTTALSFYENAGLCDSLLSFELAMAKIPHLGGEKPRGYIGYGYLPLMRMRACPARGKKGCGDCTGCNTMTDRTGRSFTIACRDRRYTVLLNDVPLYIADKKRADVDFELLYFTKEDPAAVRRVVHAYLAGEPFEGERTNGLYFRKLQ